LIIFEKSVIDIKLFNGEDLISFFNTENQLPDINIKQLNANELKLFNMPLIGDGKQKYYAATKLSSSIGDEEIGYFAISKVDYAKFSDDDLNLLNAFVNLINETIADFENQVKLVDILNDFVHKSVHDLKNPLTSISLTSELLKRKTDDPATVMKFAEKLENASKRVFDNLDHLKLAFPADDKNFKLNIEQVDLNQLLQNATATRYLKFVSTNDKTIIYADASRLRLAFECLITVASEKGQSVILEATDGHIVIKLKHNGLHDPQLTKFLMARTLIGMHKGTVNATDDSYYISLPFETP
jgi:signal transduction histidine kinase